MLKTALKIKIATANSRKSTNWKNTVTSWEDLRSRLENTIRTNETVKEYQSMSKTEKGEIKDVGGFVGGELNGTHRKAENLVNRSLLSLDLDNVQMSTEDLWEDIQTSANYELCLYTTHSHTPESPRLRLIIPTDRDMNPDEYQAVARKVAYSLGIDQFDDTTFEPSRLMYWASTPADGEFIYKYNESELLRVDSILAKYDDWKNVSGWDYSSRASANVDRLIKRQEDPLEKGGWVGHFCRTYSISETIEEFLSDIYEGADGNNRYTFVGGSSFGGLVTYDDKFAFSHHGSDPVSGKLCNAFDLVRLHLYGALDDNDEVKPNTPPNKLPSFIKMSAMAQKDKRVLATSDAESNRQLEEDFEFEGIDISWKLDLERDARGDFLNTVDNMVQILDNDPNLKGKFRHNIFSHRMIVADSVPWNGNSSRRDWDRYDDSGLRHYIEKYYKGIYHNQKLDDAKHIVFNKHQFHPVRDYLNALEWDGKKRVEKLLIDYFGAEDNIYNREVMRIHLSAAVKRVFHPGCKYDHMVTLQGSQGMGKTSFIEILAGDGWSTSSLDSVGDKSSYEKLQGVWMIEFRELSTFGWSDRNKIKGFLTAREDDYRVAYDRYVSKFPRQCVFWGSTNDKQFLIDPTGERRTLPVMCRLGKSSKDVFKDLPKERDQIWAEAVQLYKTHMADEENNKLYITGKALKIAEELRGHYKVEDDYESLIVSYLQDDYPKNWSEFNSLQRAAWVRGEREDLFATSDQLVKLDRVCVWSVVEDILGLRKGTADKKTRNQAREALQKAITQLSDEWEQEMKPINFSKFGYGTFRGYLRK